MPSARLTVGYSPCPNDCFIFYALAHGKIDFEPVDIYLADVEELNQLARRGALEVTKLSYHAFGHLADRYRMLPSGGALGRGVGPLIVTREPLADLSGRTVAVPGGLTTANLLLRLSQSDDIEYREMRYDRIMPAVEAGEVDAGLIIHESRFTYHQHGLVKHLDLGEWWEGVTGKLLPLGGIAALRSLGGARLAELDRAIRASLDYAYEHPDEVEPYVAEHAQEMSREVRQQHIDLYVNRYSRELGAEGRAAVAEFFRRGRERRLLPAVAEDAIFGYVTAE
ncbi:MAG TPA: 1,4-dihydroxy-6-naphthoate synthase [Trueperaceae bacterium]